MADNGDTQQVDRSANDRAVAHGGCWLSDAHVEVGGKRG